VIKLSSIALNTVMDVEVIDWEKESDMTGSVPSSPKPSKKKRKASQ